MTTVAPDAPAAPPAAPGPAVAARLVEVHKRFPLGQVEVAALQGIGLDIKAGEFLVILGPSGSGKTTLLNLLSGLDRPTGGAVSFQGEDLSRLPEKELVELRRRKIGFVFQSFGLMPLLSAQENVELPLHILGVSWRERRRRAQEVLDSVGLGTRARHRPYELSGGEQQRVSIARALVTQPDVVFADEPTGELDTTTARAITAILQEITANGTTVITATHDLSLAEASERRLEMVDGSLTAQD